MRPFSHAFLTGVTMVLWLGTAMSASLDPDLKKAADEVIARELAFSARAQLIDPRDAFLEFFAADGLMFRPDPVSSLERLQKSPPWGINLQWWPVEVAVSADGRLAYSTGPVEIRQQAASAVPDAFGTYFTVWRKNSQQVWEVAADLGTDTPSLWAGRSAPVSLRLPMNLDGATGTGSLTEADQAYARLASTGLCEALTTVAAAEYRFLPPHGLPVLGAAAAKPFLLAGPSSWTVMGEIATESGDFGATYGSGEGGYASGHFGYLRVWRRNESGQWQVLAELISLSRS